MLRSRWLLLLLLLGMVTAAIALQRGFATSNAAPGGPLVDTEQASATRTDGGASEVAELVGRAKAAPEERMSAPEDGPPAKLRIRVIDAEGRPAREMAVWMTSGAWRTDKQGKRRFRKAQRHSPVLRRTTENGALSIHAAWVDEVLEISSVSPTKGSDAESRRLVWASPTLYLERPVGEIVLRVEAGRRLRVHVTKAGGAPLDPWYPTSYRPSAMDCEVCLRRSDGTLDCLSTAWPADQVAGIPVHLRSVIVPNEDLVLRIGNHDLAWRPMLEVPVPDVAEDVHVELPPSRRLSVRVLDPTGAPVWGSLTLRGWWRGRPWHDSAYATNGAAVIHGLPADEPVYVGMSSSSLMGRPWLPPEEVEVRPETASLVLALERGLPVDLVVVGPGDEPVHEARISIQHLEGASWNWIGSATLTQRADGVMLLPGLAPGRYEATAEPRGLPGLGLSKAVRFSVPGGRVHLRCPAAE